MSKKLLLNPNTIGSYLYGDRYNSLTLEEKDLFSRLYLTNSDLFNNLYLQFRTDELNNVANNPTYTPPPSEYEVLNRLEPTLEEIEDKIRSNPNLDLRNPNPIETYKNNKLINKMNRANRMFGTQFKNLDDVRVFQQKYGLKVDGDVGPETINKLTQLYRSTRTLPTLNVTAPKRSSKSPVSRSSDPQRASSYQDALLAKAKLDGNKETDLLKLANLYGDLGWKGTRSYNDFYSSVRKDNTVAVGQAASDIITLPLRAASGLGALAVDVGLNEGMKAVTGKTASEWAQSYIDNNTTGFGTTVANTVLKIANLANYIRKPAKAAGLVERIVAKRANTLTKKPVRPNPKALTARPVSKTAVDPNFRFEPLTKYGGMYSKPSNARQYLSSKSGSYKLPYQEARKIFKSKGIKGREIWYVPSGLEARGIKGLYYYFKKGGKWLK